jgi:preprotein translocase subunit SecB
LPENKDDYARFLEGIDLVSVGLRACSVSLDRAGLFELYTDKKSPLRVFRHTYKVTDIGKNYFEASGSFFVSVKESQESEPKLSVECEFEAHLHGHEPIPKTLVERFVQSEFQLLLIPYGRQFVSTITAQMSIPPVVLPLSTRSSRGGPARSGVTKKTIKRADAKAR